MYPAAVHLDAHWGRAKHARCHQCTKLASPAWKLGPANGQVHSTRNMQDLCKAIIIINAGVQQPHWRPAKTASSKMRTKQTSCARSTRASRGTGMQLPAHARAAKSLLVRAFVADRGVKPGKLQHKSPCPTQKAATSFPFSAAACCASLALPAASPQLCAHSHDAGVLCVSGN